MVRIFISYSRVDRPFVDRLVPLLDKVYDSVWFDENLHGGQEWWKEILHHITACDIFIYLLSNESLASRYCRAELEEAQRLHKKILPVLVRAQTRIPEDLSEIQYVDMSAGIKSESITRLLAGIKRLSDLIPQTPPPPLTPEPVSIPIRGVRERIWIDEVKAPGCTVRNLSIALGVLLLLSVGIALFGSPVLRPSLPATAIVVATATRAVTATSPATVTPTDRLTPTPASIPYFNVYTDADAPDNHFHPSGYMGDTGDITIDERWPDKPHSGTSSIKVTYDTKGQGPHRCGIGVTPTPNCKWAGVYWQEPPNNWGTVPPSKAGFDLRGFQRLTLWGRSDTTITVRFEVGGIGWAASTPPPWPDSLLRPRHTGWVTLTNEWTQFEIDLEGADLSYVIGGFAWVANWDNNEVNYEKPKLLVFYLDDIRYER